MNRVDVTLNPHERVLWTGRPGQTGAIRPADLIAGWTLPVLFVLTTGGVMVASAVNRGEGLSLTAILFLLFVPGTWVVAALARAHQLRSARYTLTTERLIIVMRDLLLRRRDRIAQLSRLAPTLGAVNSRGDGTITFGEPDLDLRAIPDAQAVYQLIVDARATPSDQSSIAQSATASPATGSQRSQDERVLWIGRPIRTVDFGPDDWALTVFGSVFMVFALFAGSLTLASPTADPPPMLMLIFSGFFLLGAWFAVGRTVLRSRRLRTTEYMLTDRRLIITCQTLGRTQEISENVTRLPIPVPKARPDGSGTIRFGRDAWKMSRNGVQQEGDDTRQVTLQAIPDVWHVHQLIVTARAGASE